MYDTYRTTEQSTEYPGTQLYTLPYHKFKFTVYSEPLSFEPLLSYGTISYRTRINPGKQPYLESNQAA